MGPSGGNPSGWESEPVSVSVYVNKPLKTVTLICSFSEFTHECIKKILTLYNTAANKPSSVVLVGHSMVSEIALSSLLGNECHHNFF